MLSTSHPKPSTHLSTTIMDDLTHRHTAIGQHAMHTKGLSGPTLQGTRSVDDKQMDGANQDLAKLSELSFTSSAAVMARVASAGDQGRDSLTVSGVSVAAFQGISEALKHTGRKTRLFYLSEKKVLIVTIPNRPHESLHLRLYSRVSSEIARMGLYDAWDDIAATRYQGKSSRPGASVGEGDSGGGPLPDRDGAGWQTLVIEAGYTQSLSSLRAKMAFWFAASGHDVKIVLLAKAFPEERGPKRILIEHWQERMVPVGIGQPGATGTTLSTAHSAGTMLEPSCLQTISIVWAREETYEEASPDQQRDPSSFNVSRGPLTLDFECLFLRQPMTAAEHNIVLDDDMLRRYAAVVWRGATGGPGPAVN